MLLILIVNAIIILTFNLFSNNAFAAYPGDCTATIYWRGNCYQYEYNPGTWYTGWEVTSTGELARTGLETREAPYTLCYVQVGHYYYEGGRWLAVSGASFLSVYGFQGISGPGTNLSNEFNFQYPPLTPGVCPNSCEQSFQNKISECGGADKIINWDQSTCTGECLPCAAQRTALAQQCGGDDRIIDWNDSTCTGSCLQNEQNHGPPGCR